MSRSFFARMGLCFTEGRLVYNPTGGFGYRWMPSAFLNALALVWNRTACLFAGHDRTLCNVHTDPRRTMCCYCYRLLKATPTEQGYAAQNEQTYRAVLGGDGGAEQGGAK